MLRELLVSLLDANAVYVVTANGLPSRVAMALNTLICSSGTPHSSFQIEGEVAGKVAPNVIVEKGCKINTVHTIYERIVAERLGKRHAGAVQVMRCQ